MTINNTDNVRRSKEDKLLEGTMLMLKDNKEKYDVINKLIYFSECLNTAPLSNDDVLKPYYCWASFFVTSRD